MDALLTSKGGERLFLLGNEALVRGALEAGVVVATTYPGTPSSEIGDTLAALKDSSRYYFEYSTNEKVALEVAYGASMAGARALCFMKHVGLNVAADPLMTLVYAGTPGGMVLISADDPGCHSSQNEQDNRHYARLGKLPMMEPSTPDEARRMLKAAFALSEQVQLPVLLRTTTRLNHMRGTVSLEPLPPVGELRRTLSFQRAPTRFVCVPGNAKKLHPVLEQKLVAVRSIAEGENAFNLRIGGGRVGLLTSGVSFNYVMDAISELSVGDRVEVARPGMTHPLPTRWLANFLMDKDEVLVVEELEPFLEEQLKLVAYDAGLHPRIYGKASGHFPLCSEFSTELVTAAIASVLGIPYEMPEAQAVSCPLPSRPPTLCAGCAHRATFYAAKLVTRNQAIYHTDIGCYALGYLPPLNLADVLISMGSSINTASGISRVTDVPSIAFIGDSTFFHGGLTGLVNAIHNEHQQVIVVVDNGTTGMTGHQPHPGTEKSGMGQDVPKLSIEHICRGMGLSQIYTVNPFNLRQTVETLERAIHNKGLSVVVSRAPCIFIDRKRVDSRPRYQVVAHRCRSCGSHGDHVGCAQTKQTSTQLERATRKVRFLPIEPSGRLLTDKPTVAPCVTACPVSLCVQSYATLIASGRTLEAARVIREKIPLPATLGRICHHPCEKACTRRSIDAPVAICDLKRFAMESEETGEAAAALRARVACAPVRNLRVAVVGGGPAGLACAQELRFRGYSVTIFEAADRLGGLLALGIPSFRLPKAVVNQEIALLVDALDLDIRLGQRMGQDFAIPGLFSEGYRAVFVACGAWKGMRLDVPGEDGPGVFDALTLLKQVSQGEAPSLGSRVAVIGGGDAAIDTARTALRLTGGEVTIYYRRTEKEMPAQSAELSLAREEGVKIELLIAPVEVLRSADGKVRALRLVRMTLGEPDRSGRRRPVPVPGSELDVPLETVIAAIGQQPDASSLPGTVRRTGWGAIVAHPLTQETTYPGVFAGGDAVTGPKTVIDAMAAGQNAAYGIDRMLSGAAALPAPHRASPPLVDAPEWHPSGVAPVPRVERPHGSGGPPLGFEEVGRGFTEAQAKAEAERCLACGHCASCNICVDTLACPAFVVTDGIIAIDEALCNGCGLCAQVCPNGAIVPVMEQLEV